MKEMKFAESLAKKVRKTDCIHVLNFIIIRKSLKINQSYFYGAINLNRLTQKCSHVQVDMTKIRLEVVKPWVTEKITNILGMEDDVVIEYVFNQLEAEKVSLCQVG